MLLKLSQFRLRFKFGLSDYFIDLDFFIGVKEWESNACPAWEGAMGWENH